MSLPRPSFKTCLVVLVVLATATTGLALASTTRDGGVAGNSAASAPLALGKAKAAAGRARAALGRARAAGPKRRIRDGAEVPVASPGLITGAAPASSADPAPPASAPDPIAPAPAPEPPVEPSTPTAPEPPAPEPSPAPEPPPPPPAEPEQPAPAPEPAPPPPPPPPPPQTSTPEIDPSVPVDPAPSPGGGSLVLSIDGGYTGWSGSEIAHRKQLGAAVTRHEWDPLDPVAEQDEEVQIAAGEIHTRILALLGGNDLGDATHYREWVVAFVRRYGSGGTFWAAHPELDESRYAIDTIELGNEPYFGEMPAEEYAATVRPALEAIKAQDLPVKVVLAQRVYGTDTSWMDTLYARIPNLNSLFYAFAEHPYWYGHDPAQVSPAGPFGRIEQVRQRMNEKGAAGKPIYLTEYGESTADCGSECVSEAVQAEHLQAMLDAIVSHPAWNVGLLSVFQLIDRGTHDSDRERQFGILRQDGTQKPSYPIVRAAMQQYR
jgi:hypothetical protein